MGDSGLRGQVQSGVERDCDHLTEIFYIGKEQILQIIYLYSEECDSDKAGDGPEEANALVVDRVRGAVQGEEDEGAHAEDDGALAEEGARVRPLVGAGVGRLGEVGQGVQQEHRGGAHQVEEQRGGLHVMVILTPVLGKVIEHNHKVHGDH